MASKARLDMRGGDARHLCRKRSAERARRIALHDHQLRGLLGKHFQNRPADQPGMNVRVVLPGAAKADRREAAKAVIGDIEAGMLAGYDQQRIDSVSGERAANGGELDRFGTGADDDSDATGQPSP